MYIEKLAETVEGRLALKELCVTVCGLFHQPLTSGDVTEITIKNGRRAVALDLYDKLGADTFFEILNTKELES